jgi:hypothetical protein
MKMISRPRRQNSTTPIPVRLHVRLRVVARTRAWLRDWQPTTMRYSMYSQEGRLQTDVLTWLRVRKR